MSIRTLPFYQVEGFANLPAGGNPAPVVLNSDGLTARQKAHFAGYIRQSETGYIGKPTLAGADFRLEVFYGGGEVGFVGTVLIAACHAWLEEKGMPGTPGQIVVEQQGELIVLRRTANGLAFICPPPDRSDTPDSATIASLAAMLNIPESDIVSAGYQNAQPPRIAVQLGSAAAVIALRPRDVTLEVCVWGFYDQPAPSLLEAKILFPGGVDAVCGNSSGWLARYLFDKGSVTGPAVISQGCTLGRVGVVHISRQTNGDIIVEGGTFTTIKGVVSFDI